MQPNKTDNIILDDIKSQEYQIDKVMYNVNRIFGDKTVRDILLEKLSGEIAPFIN